MDEFLAEIRAASFMGVRLSGERFHRMVEVLTHLENEGPEKIAFSPKYVARALKKRLRTASPTRVRETRAQLRRMLIPRRLMKTNRLSPYIRESERRGRIVGPALASLESRIRA